jgi:hypothetical protein
VNGPTSLPPARPASERYFFAGAAALVLVTTVLGFRHFYFEGRAWPGRPITPPIRGLVIAHALGMTAWLLLAVVQPLLVGRRAVALHRKLGWAAAALVLLLVPIAYATAIQGMKLAPADMMFGPFTAQQFLAEPMLVVTGFALFVGLGVWQRRRPAAHRALLFTGTVLVASAGPARLDVVLGFYAETPLMRVFGDMLPSLVLGLLVLAGHRAITGMFDRWLLGCWLALVGWTVFIQHTITAAWWQPVGAWLLR